MDKKQEIIEEYQQKDFVSTFDKTRSEHIFHKEKHEFERKIIKDALHSLKGENISVLDVACGTGRMFPEIENDKRASYTGLDTSKEMLEQFKEKFKGKKFNLVLSDASKMPFEDNTFDLSFTYHLLWHIPIKEQEEILKEMIRVTKKGGIIIFDSVNKDFLLEKIKRIRGLSANQEMYKLSISQVKKIIYPNKLEIYKLLDPEIKNEKFFMPFKILNKAGKILPSSLFHMIFFKCKKIT